MPLKRHVKKVVDTSLSALGYKLVKDLPPYYLHEYKNYEEYCDLQKKFNRLKLGNVWADEDTLSVIVRDLQASIGYQSAPFQCLCHGSRNGFEVQTFSKLLPSGSRVIGTDISETATQFDSIVQWDFHDINDQWLSRFDLIYTNSWDQSWKPFEALTVWLNQLKLGSFLYIEHSKEHGPKGASEMDPFGIDAEYLPYYLASKFGHQISLKILKTTKSNFKCDVWLFVLKKNVDSVVLLSDSV